MVDKVEEYYDSNVNKEANRLIVNPWSKIEFITTTHYLEKYLPKKGHILDLGCGTGVYAVPLAKKGYDITLVDISKGLLDHAVKDMKKNKLENKLKGFIHSSAINLSTVKDNQFDAVICFGPLYHLLDKKDQIKLLEEIYRVSKKGAIIFIAAISYYGFLDGLIGKYKKLLLSNHLDNFLKTGSRKRDWFPKKGSYFTDAQFHKPEELRKLIEKKGFKFIDMFACEGIATFFAEETNQLYKNKKAWDLWIKIIIENSNKESIIGSTVHFVTILKK